MKNEETAIWDVINSALTILRFNDSQDYREIAINRLSSACEQLKSGKGLYDVYDEAPGKEPDKECRTTRRFGVQVTIVNNGDLIGLNNLLGEEYDPEYVLGASGDYAKVLWYQFREAYRHGEVMAQGTKGDTQSDC